MVSTHEIENLVQQLAQDFSPKKIVLFGSHAEKMATEDSDVDLLIVLPFQDKPWKTAFAIRKSLHVKFPVDLLVRTPEQIQDRLNSGDTFLREILQHGVTMYEN